MKQCSNCKELKSLDQYYTNAKTNKRTGTKCRECFKAYSREWKKNNKERKKELDKNWYIANGEYRRAQIRQQKFGISAEQYKAMLQTQSELCGICGKHQSTFNKGLAVDHCHTSGKIRGLLCSYCNLMLGNSLDNIETLTKAIDYLRRNQT
jgi:hypothetical protein